MHGRRLRLGSPPGLLRCHGRAGEERLGSRPERLVGNAMEARREAQVVGDGEVALEAEGLRNVAEPCLQIRHVAAEIEAVAKLAAAAPARRCRLDILLRMSSPAAQREAY